MVKERYCFAVLRQHAVNQIFLKVATKRLQKRHGKLVLQTCLSEMRDLYARYKEAEKYSQRRVRQKTFLAMCQNALLGKLERDLNRIALDQYARTLTTSSKVKTAR